MDCRLANRMQHVRPSAIRELMRLGADPSVISFGGGYPDASLFPIEQLARVFQLALHGRGREALQYSESNGIARLRTQIAGRLTRDGIECTADDVLILQGAQQGLDLVAKMLIDKGDTIITENPTFLGALIAFNPYEPAYACVQIDSEGMDMNDLERTLRRRTGARLLYTVPDFQNPTGVTMSLARRRTLLELANKFGLIVLEDTPYREVRFEGDPVASLKSLDTEGRVIHLGSFSKILAPGLRLGWIVAEQTLIGQLALLKLAADTQCSTLNMHAVSLFLDECDIDRHILSIRDTYRRKKNLMLDAMGQTFPEDVSFTNPGGGMFTWLTFPAGFDAAQFMLEHALPKAKVAYVPGAPFFPLQQPTNHARLSYSSATDEAIVSGVAALGELLTSTRRTASRLR